MSQRAAIDRYPSFGTGGERPEAVAGSFLKQLEPLLRYHLTQTFTSAHVLHACHGIVQGSFPGFGRLFESGVLVPILKKHTCATIPISAIYPSNKQLNARVRGFVDWIVERLAH